MINKKTVKKYEPDIKLIVDAIRVLEKNMGSKISGFVYSRRELAGATNISLPVMLDGKGFARIQIYNE